MQRVEHMSLWEKLYFPEITRGLFVTGYRFWRNLAIHTLHLYGLAKNKSAAVTIQYPEERIAYPDTFRGRHRALHRLLSLLHRLPGRVHLHRGGRVSRQSGGKIPRALRDRYAALHLLRLLRRGLSVRRDTHGHRPPSRQPGLFAPGLRRGQKSPDGALAKAGREGQGRALRRGGGTLPARLASLIDLAGVIC